MHLEHNELLPYRVGALLYTPALTRGLAEKLLSRAYPGLTAMALCLEDSIADSAVAAAEEQLKITLEEIRQTVPADDRPLLFVRVRTPEHLQHVHQLLGSAAEILTGYILPKFDLGNAADYIAILKRINEGSKAFFIMPTLESGMVADPRTRVEALAAIREALAPVRQWVLNVRVGGNDFCNLFGVRRAVHQTIYDVGLVRDILVEILNVFSGEYVVSGPVWEYFGTDDAQPWAHGLRRELELDLLNGFIGKTAIHPTQLPVISEGLMVSRHDYDDALNILNWNESGLAVGKSADGQRMNEVKCHGRWARRIVARGMVYGVKKED